MVPHQRHLHPFLGRRTTTAYLPACSDATAAKEREAQKRTKRKNDRRLIPCVLETGRRWVPTAEKWSKNVAPTDLQERSVTLADLRCDISTALQRSNADMILTAHIQAHTHTPMHT